jgi:probable HAF family extracellular repeat protein
MSPLLARPLLTILAISLFVESRSHAAGLYQFTDLGNFQPQLINSQGMVVSNPSYGVVAPSVVYSAYGPNAGQLTPIPGSFIAQGINAQGQVISGSPTGPSIVSEPDSGVEGMGSFRTVASDPSKTFLGINDGGQIVGETFSGHPFFESGGKLVGLGLLGQSNGSANAINASGQIVGDYELGGPGAIPYRGTYHAFLSSGGSLTDLGSLGGGYSQASAINAAGQVIGVSTTASGAYHSFLYSDGKMVDLSNLGGATGVSVSAINATGSMVGSLTTADGASHAFLYSDGVMHDLNNLLPLPTGWNLIGAGGITDAGQIIGEASDPSGADHGFLLTPVDMASATPPTPTPEPATLAIFGLAGAGLVARRALGRG